MFVPSRSRRRHERDRMQCRMIARWKMWSLIGKSVPPAHWLHSMVETHGVPCSSFCCGNRRRHEGPKRVERIDPDRRREIAAAGG